ncbi:MAG: S26 family signal peptidase [Rhizomicrobium sp.]
MENINPVWDGLKRFLGVADGKGFAKALLEPVAIVAITFASTTALAQPFYVPSGSMQPTLAIGDAFVAAKYPYGYSRYSVPFGLGPASSDRCCRRCPSAATSWCSACPAIRARPTSSASSACRAIACR